MAAPPLHQGPETILTDSEGVGSQRAAAPFLVFEGLDGSGKSTLIRKLSEHLRTRAKKSILTREPGGTPLAEEIRSLLLRTDCEIPAAATELLLYAASRAQHVSQVIQPALARGDWVLCDRFVASSVAFQCFARGIVRESVDSLNRFASQGLRPSLTVLLDLSVEECSARQSGRLQVSGQSADRMELESRIFHERVRDGYLAQAHEEQLDWLVLDATSPPHVLLDSVIKQLELRRWLE